MFGFGKKLGPIIGLEVNSNAIAILQLEKVKTDLKVSRFASTLTPPDIVREGIFLDPDAVGRAVRELLDSAGYAAKGPQPRINMSIPGQSIISRLMPVPQGMPADELADVVRQEASNILPFPIEEANIDWGVVPGTVRLDPDGVEREDILLTAIQKPIVDSYTRMADAAGIDLNRLDVSSFAALKALTFAGILGAESKLSLVVNIRYDATDIILANKTAPLFNRSVLLGAEAVIEGMARGISGSLPEAAELLPQIQLLGAPTLDPRLSQAAQVARSVCADLTAEIGRSLEFYMSQVGMVTVDQAIICGAGVSIPEIDQFISNRLNLRTIIANPFQGIMYDQAQILEERRAFHSELIGLTVDPENVETETIQVNLYQPDGERAEGAEAVVDDTPAPWFVPALAGGGGITVIALLFMLFMQFFAIPGKDKEIAETEQAIQEAKTKVANMSKQQDDVKLLELRKQGLAKVIQHGTPVTVIFKTVQENIPAGVRIFTLKADQNQATVVGGCSDFSKAANLCINLQGTNLFAAADLAFVTRVKERPSQIVFEIFTVLGSELKNKVENDPVGAISGGNVVVGRSKVLDFFATWCPPCQRMKPFMEEAQKKYGAQIEFVTVDIDDPKNADLVAHYDVKSVPNLYFLNAKGDVIEHLKGFGGNGNSIYGACDKLISVASKTTVK